MAADPIVQIDTEIRQAERLMWRAMAARNAPVAESCGDSLRELTSRLWERDPTTPAGAAIKLREAVDVLREREDPDSRRLARGVNPIARRLARGDRRLADLIALRAARSLASENDICDVSALIDSALKGAATLAIVATGAAPRVGVTP